MERPILILIKSDPMESHRPVEAARIALGLASGEHPVQIILMNQAPLLLSEDYEDLKDGELLPKYLPTFKEWGQAFYVEDSAWKRLKIETDHKVIPISPAGIAELVGNAARFMTF